MSVSNVIAIDGPAASGKSTIARLLAKRLSIPYLSTGSMYRALTWHAMNSGIDTENPNEDALEKLLSKTSLEYIQAPDGQFDIVVNGVLPGAMLRSPEIAAHVSRIAALPLVRNWLLDRQRKLAEMGLIVMEGRDIGTVIFPAARHKFFLTASPLVRAKRRLAQDGETPDGATIATVAAEIAKRDELDMNRPIAPLKQAPDAILVDSSEMDIEEVISLILEKIRANS
ncbi:MAG: cytidylate kinase [Lentisphaerae bacterium GWF2_52_8]|nr:MAG: cytidylate kinase [Lentisphaerae bacterium GWF2_52_8]